MNLKTGQQVWVVMVMSRYMTAVWPGQFVAQSENGDVAFSDRNGLMHFAKPEMVFTTVAEADARRDELERMGATKGGK